MVYLIYSLDKEIIDKYIKKIIEKENIDENSIVKYSLEDDNVLDICDEYNTSSLFSLKKLIIVEATNVFSSKGKDITELSDCLNNKSSNIIIFTAVLDKLDTRKNLYKKINLIGKIESLNKDNNYIINLVKEKLNGFEISNNDIDYFLKKVGNDISNIENELEKLINYKYEDKIIKREDIDLLCESNIEEEIFALTDAIVKNDINKSITLYNLFLNKNYDVTQMIGLISSQFRFLLQVKILYNKNKSNDEIAKILGVHPYRVKLAIGNCYYYSKEILEDYLIKLFELDKKIKLGLIDKNIFFQLFILNKDI